MFGVDPQFGLEPHPMKQINISDNMRIEAISMTQQQVKPSTSTRTIRMATVIGTDIGMLRRTVRRALRFIRAVRDTYWLGRHPIDYA